MANSSTQSGASGFTSADDINPRMAAFLSSYGREPTLEAANRFTRAFSNAEFMAFIARAKATAPAEIIQRGQVADQDAFTLHCWSVAQTDTLRRFPA